MITLASLALLLMLPWLLTAQSPPRIFFSDLESGPNIGGQKNHGRLGDDLGQGLWRGARRFDSNNRRRRCGGVSHMD